MMITYYYIIVSGPIDICKKYMLRENKRIYALLVCFITGIRYAFEGLFFEEYIGRMYYHFSPSFYLTRFFVIIFYCVAVLTLVSIVREETSEALRGKKLEPGMMPKKTISTEADTHKVSSTQKRGEPGPPEFSISGGNYSNLTGGDKSNTANRFQKKGNGSYMSYGY